MIRRAVTSAAQTRLDPVTPRLDTHLREVRPRIHKLRLLTEIVLVLIVAWIIVIIVGNPKLETNVVAQFFFSGRVLHGLANTLILTAISMTLAFALGVALALMRLSDNVVAKTISFSFVWIVRSVPPLVQIIFWYNLGFLFARLAIRIPFGPVLYSAPTNQVMGVFVAATLGLLLNVSGYMAEIIRGGILSVDHGQHLAGMTLGMSGRTRIFRVILPQAMPAILPGTGNQLINTLKSTSLVSVIGLPDLLGTVQDIYSANLKVIPLLVVASLWYLIVTSILSIGQGYLERYFHRTAAHSNRRQGAFWKIRRRAASMQKPNAAAVEVPAAGGSSPAPGSADTRRQVSVNLVGGGHGDSAELAPTGILNARGLTKSFGDVMAVNDVSFDVQEGSVYCIIGPSGSGKSTLLSCIGMLQNATSGGVYLDGGLLGYEEFGNGRRVVSEDELDRQRTEVGMVFQNFNLFANMTALENVTCGQVWVRGTSKAAARARSLELLDRVGLSAVSAHYPRQLSGGQQQRVAIARCLAMDPRVMLFDEPTSALDPELVGEVLTTMQSLASKGMTMLVVTHELNFARGIATRVGFMKDGILRGEGTPEEMLNNPSDDVLRQFVSRVHVK